METTEQLKELQDQFDLLRDAIKKYLADNKGLLDQIKKANFEYYQTLDEEELQSCIEELLEKYN